MNVSHRCTDGGVGGEVLAILSKDTIQPTSRRQPHRPFRYRQGGQAARSGSAVAEECRRSQQGSHRLLRSRQRRARMLLAPESDQNMSECLRRWPTSALHSRLRRRRSRRTGLGCGRLDTTCAADGFRNRRSVGSLLGPPPFFPSLYSCLGRLTLTPFCVGAFPCGSGTEGGDEGDLLAGSGLC